MPTARQTIGPFSRQVINRTAKALPELWLTLNRDGHRNDSNDIVTACFEEVRQSPLLQICRDVRDEGDAPLNEEHSGAERMLKFLSRREGHARLPAAFCATGTLVARKIEEIRQLAKVETNEAVRKQYDCAFQLLKRHLATIVQTGIMTELPLAARRVEVEALVMERLAGVLFERWHVLLRAAEAPNFERWVCRDLGMMLGLGMFDSVRAQEFGMAEIGLEGLVRHLERPQPRFRKNLIPIMAFSTDQMMRVALNLREHSFKAPAGSRLRQNRFNATLCAWIGVVNVWRTGIFEAIAA